MSASLSRGFSQPLVPWCLIFLTALSLGCGAGGGPANEAPASNTPTPTPPPPFAIADIPPPSEIKAAQTFISQVFFTGNEYQSTSPHQNVTAWTSTIVFAPDYDPGNGTSDLAYAIYAFDTTGYDHDSLLRTGWITDRDYDDCWILMADFTADSWRWYTLTPFNHIVFNADACVSEDAVLAAVVMTGTDSWELSYIHLGNRPPPKVYRVEPVCGNAGDEVTFEPFLNTELGEPTAWSWDFGGGATPNAPSSAQPVVTLGPPGLYECSVEASNAAGAYEHSFWFNVCPAGSGGWIEVVEPASGIGDATSLALELEHEYPRIAYSNDATNWLYLASRDEVGWRTEVVEKSAYDINTSTKSLAIDSDNTPHLAYYDYPKLIHSWQEGGGWPYEYYDDSEEGMVFSDFFCPGIALTSANGVRLSYVESGFFGGDPFCVVWYLSTAISGDSYDEMGVARYCSMDLDQDNQPGVLYHDKDPNELRFAKYDPGTQDWDETLVSGGSGIGSIDLVISKDTGMPYVCFEKSGTLRYGFHDGSNWQLATIADTGTVGDFVSIDLSSTDRPFICYYEQTEDELRYVERVMFDWPVRIVDSAGDVGRYCDIALDAAGSPHFSYYDTTHQLVKYAQMPEM